MTTTPTETFLDTLATEDAALDAIHAIRERFGFTGITFTADDVAAMTASALSWHPREFSDAFFSSVIATVQGSREYRDLADTIVDSGNQALGDAMERTVGLLEDGNGYTYGAQLLVERGGALVPALGRDGFSTALAAFRWARQCVAAVSRAHPASKATRIGLLVQHDGQQLGKFVSKPM